MGRLLFFVDLTPRRKYRQKKPHEITLYLLCASYDDHMSQFFIPLGHNIASVAKTIDPPALHLSYVPLSHLSKYVFPVSFRIFNIGLTPAIGDVVVRLHDEDIVGHVSYIHKDPERNRWWLSHLDGFLSAYISELKKESFFLHV